MKHVQALTLLLLQPRALLARLTWPLFSVSSYTMVSSLARQGIVPRTVIDVGANVGQFAVTAAKLFPAARIHSVEPLPECLRLLQRHVRKLTNVTIHPCAIGDSPGEADFHVNRHSHSSSLLALDDAHIKAFPGAIATRTIKVPVRTLDGLLSDAALREPVLLKLDVQGYEVQALRGAPKLLERVDYLLMETSFRPMYRGEMPFTDVLPLTKGLGFRFLRPLDWLADPATGEILQMDALFART